jgi:hypothetical protein
MEYLNPKDKAKALYDKYRPLFFGSVAYKSLAKQCATIEVKGIIQALENYDDITEHYLKKEFPDYFSCQLQNMDSDFRYWEKVLSELETK